jgi:hypothetical protein
MKVIRWRHRVGAALALGVVLGLVSAGTSFAATATQPAGAGFAATAQQSLSRFPFCSWWFETTPQTTNVALPDTSAAYWTTPFYASPGLKIYVKGQFPDARFMSVTVYDNNGGTFTSNGVSSGLVDYQIAPDKGTTNPFQQPARGPGLFTLTIQRNVSSSQSNVLPLVPDSSTTGSLLPPGFGFITMRVYLPHSGSFSSVHLPTLIFSRNGRPQTLQTCSSNNPVEQQLVQALELLVKNNASSATTKFPPSSGTPAFARPEAATTNSLFPNVASAYLAATFSPTPGTVLVVQGKAPTHTPDSTALPWPNSSYDLRYWSLCNNEDVSPYKVVNVMDPQTGDQIYGCSADLNTPVVNGDYTYVLSSLADRPANATTADGVAWLPYSSNQVEQVLLFRNMLSNGFAYAIQNVPEDGNPASASAAMGAYYPRIAQCSVSTFTQGGPSACFAASS